MISKKIYLYLLILISLIIFIFFYLFSLKYTSSNEFIETKEQLNKLIEDPEFNDYIEEQELDSPKLRSLFGGDECLISKKEAINILSNSYGINNSDPDENIRFILGKCNPVLLIPGIYATKLIVEFQCKNIANYEKTTTLKNLRLYCGNTICEDETKDREEHALFMGIFDEAFTFAGKIVDKYSSCLGFVSNYFQNPNECPAVNNKNICYYSQYIKVGYYGSSTNTVRDSRCGLEAVQNVIQTGNLKIDNIINIGKSKSYSSIIKTLINRGYKEGFSLGALPNDYRRNLANNNFAENVFISQINRLYKNTGKPVVIVAHSYGALLTLTNLIKKKNDASFLKKIKKFLAIAPPFAGATMLLDEFLHGFNGWDKDIKIFEKKIRISNYNIFGQLLMYKTLPTITELRPLSIATKILSDSKYSTLGKAITDRINAERECKSQKCPLSTLELKTASFDKIFKGYYPSLTDSECAYESYLGRNKNTYSRKCYTNIYNVAECPSLVTKSINPTQTGLDNDEYCGKKGTNYYYQGDCTNDRNCLDNIYSAENKCPNVFKNTEAINYLLNRFNKYYSYQYGELDQNYFDTYDQIREGVKKSIQYQDENSLIKDLPLPPVDTDIIYSSYSPTISMVVVNDDDFSKEGKVLYRGGDEVVPTWSSLLTGLKWIYEMKNNPSYKNKIRLIEYCSRLANNGQYKYDPTIDQNFAALSCYCLNKKNFYLNDVSPCAHGAMINDKSLINYIISIVDDPKERNTVTDEKKYSVNNYKKNYNYEKECNLNLKYIFETCK